MRFFLFSRRNLCFSHFFRLFLPGKIYEIFHCLIFLIFLFLSCICLVFFTLFSARLISLEASATSSSLYLLWTVSGAEREQMGSKCLAGLQIVTCKSSKKDQINQNIGGNNYHGNSHHNDNMNNNNSSNNNNNSNHTSKNIKNFSLFSTPTTPSTDTEEHILVLKRPQKDDESDVPPDDRNGARNGAQGGDGSSSPPTPTDRLVKGDRVLISLEREDVCGSELYGNKKVGSVRSVRSVQANGIGCGDIEDISSKIYYTNNTNHTNNTSNPNTTSHFDSCSSTRRDGLSPIEPNLAAGQVSFISLTEIHVSLKRSPKRLLRLVHLLLIAPYC